jgi:hypothetical protein
VADNDFEIFDGKSFKDLCKDIYDRSDSKHEQLDLLISELRPYIRSLDDAMQVVPKIQGYLEISVKNDEQLVKLSQVVQRLQTAKLESGGSEILTEAEKEALWKEVKAVAEEVRVPIPTSGSLVVAQR